MKWIFVVLLAFSTVYAKDLSGFKIISLKKGSIYEQLGFKSGDTIKAVNKKTIKTEEDATGIFDQLKNTNKVEIEFIRNGKTQKAFFDIK